MAMAICGVRALNEREEMFVTMFSELNGGEQELSAESSIDHSYSKQGDHMLPALPLQNSQVAQRIVSIQ